MFTVVVATVAVDIAANTVSPANDFANALPRLVGFKTGGLITGILSIVIQPWKLLANPSRYIYTWLLGYSDGLGSIGDVLIADYWILRRRELRLEELYLADGIDKAPPPPSHIARSSRSPDDVFEPIRLLGDDSKIPHPRRIIQREVRHRQRLEISSHRRHRRVQLVGDVSEKLATHAVRRHDAVSHGIESPRDGGHLVTAAIRRAGRQITGAQTTRRGLEHS